MAARHKLIYGMTQMGKTWLLKRIVKVLRKHKQKVIVYSGVGDLDWPSGCLVTHSIEQLETWLGQHTKAHVIIDEGRVLYAKMKPSLHPNIDNLFTMGRHRGFTNYIATQFPTSIPPAVRVNCSEMYCFKLGSKKHALLVQEDFGDLEYNGKPIFNQILKLPPCECFHVIAPDTIKKLSLK